MLLFGQNCPELHISHVRIRGHQKERGALDVLQLPDPWKEVKGCCPPIFT